MTRTNLTEKNLLTEGIAKKSASNINYCGRC